MVIQFAIRNESFQARSIEDNVLYIAQFNLFTLNVYGRREQASYASLFERTLSSIFQLNCVTKPYSYPLSKTRAMVTRRERKYNGQN